MLKGLVVSGKWWWCIIVLWCFCVLGGWGGKDFFKLFLYICAMTHILISFGISLIATIFWVFGTDIDAVDDDTEFP